MKIVQPYAKIVSLDNAMRDGGTTGTDLLRDCETAARISHRSEDGQTEDSWDRFLRTVVMGHGDFSVIEHRGVTVEFLVDRGITHEIVRHRIASYTQESTRFVNYEKKMEPGFIYPKPDVQCVWCMGGQEPVPNNFAWSHSDPVDALSYGCEYDKYWLNLISHCEHAYKALLADGWRPQEARSVFPNALASKLWMTTNLRGWRHFFIMRTTAEAHPQMRQVTIPLLAMFQQEVPILFEDIMPGARQIDNMKLPR